MIDIELVMQDCGDDPSMVLELATMFLGESARQMSAIEQALSAKNGGDMQFAAHRLRGGLAIFVADSAVQAAETVELIGSRRQMEKAPEAVTRLKGELVQVANDLRALIAIGPRIVSIN
jgi:HPt (histidine-containing phosphotransfer) domain-containing protein